MSRPLFCDLPDDTRMAFRNAVEDAGGTVECYDRDAILVAIPRPAGPFYRAMNEAGLELVGDSLWYMPLGSEVSFTPDHLRHDGRYPGSRGYSLNARFRPK